MYSNSSSAAGGPMEVESSKPQCGSESEVGEYDLPMHVLALFLVLGFSIIGAGFPVLARRVKWMKVPTKVFFVCKHFGTGVLIATAFVHLLPVAFGNLLNPCLPDLFTEKYPPLPGVIMMASLFCLFVLEMWLNSKTGGNSHSHGGPTGFESGPTAPAPARPSRPPMEEDANAFEPGPLSDEKRVVVQTYDDQGRRHPELPLPNLYADKDAPSEMPPWFVVFYEQYVRHQHDMANMIKAGPRPLTSDSNPPEKGQDTVVATRALAAGGGDFPDSPYIDVETGLGVDPAVFKRMSTNISLLEGGILFHSIFVGITISITIDGFIILVIAILFHQMFEGLGLGSRIAAVPYPRDSIRPWVLVVAFGTVAPIGQAIGLATRGAYDPNSAFGLIIVGVFNAISAGLLIYAALVDLLAEDFLSEEANRVMTKKDKTLAFILVLLGAAGMSIVGAFA